MSPVVIILHERIKFMLSTTNLLDALYSNKLQPIHCVILLLHPKQYILILIISIDKTKIPTSTKEKDKHFNRRINYISNDDVLNKANISEKYKILDYIQNKNSHIPYKKGKERIS